MFENSLLYKYVSRETLEISKDKPYSFQFSVKSYMIISKTNSSQGDSNSNF